MPDIKITGATHGNLKNLSLTIPKNQFVVFTGLSGSGKSTLLIDVLFNECQRQYLEALSMQGIPKPKVERIQGASPAILISQTYTNTNPRSTVGTMTDIYTDLRMVYEKLGLRKCPFCRELISAADCKETTEKIRDDFHVYMDCCKCGRRMDKLTRTHFSFNTKEGACPVCEGLGRIHRPRKDRIVDESLSLEDGAILYWEKQYGSYQITIYRAALSYYGIPVPNGLPVRQFSALQKAVLYDGIDCDLIKSSFPDQKPPKTAALGKFEGVYPILRRRFAEKEGGSKRLDDCFDIAECPECKGERLSGQSRSVTVNGVRLPQLSLVSFEKLYEWVRELAASLPDRHREQADVYLTDIRTKLARIIHVGLGYLSSDRQIITLSGGELQRLRLAAVLDSDLTGVIYILDEPTAGLHPKDTAGLIAILKKLRDLGNSVLVIEHDTDIMAAADSIIEIGPGAGKYGGEIVAAGTLKSISRPYKAEPEAPEANRSPTGTWLNSPHPVKTCFRSATGTIHIANADRFNLKHISVDIPTGCITAVTGPSGSGKSTLIFEVLAQGGESHESAVGKHGHGCLVSGLEHFEKVIRIEQAPITKMKRSNIATYSGVYSEIRSVFAGTAAAAQLGLTAKHFSFNTPGGRCENCQGLGYVDCNMLFFSDTEILCPVCKGLRFSEQVLSVTYKGLSVNDVLKLSVSEAAAFFSDRPKLFRILKVLEDVGLGYPELGQTLTTLSGGECQRLKLARELSKATPNGECNLYLMDEPTTGLHPKDIEYFLLLLNRMADAGNTVVVVEHNRQLIRSCDWIIDLGPEGGEKGGEIVFTGTPQDMIRDGKSINAKYL